MAPILSFTATETWEHLYNLDQSVRLNKSVFFADFPPALTDLLDNESEARWSRLIAIRSEFTKALEIARREKIIGHPLEAEVLVLLSGELGDFLQQEIEQLKEISIVSALSGVEELPDIGLAPYFSEEIPGLSIMVRPAEGDKCERCWTRSPSVGKNSDHPVICGRCCATLAEIGSNAEEL